MDPMGNWRSIPLHLLDVMSILGAGLHELDAKKNQPTPVELWQELVSQISG